jgi:hypothetical protein
MSLDKQLLSFDHRRVFKLNVVYELPLGRSRSFGKTMNAILDGVVGGWQAGRVYNYTTGARRSGSRLRTRSTILLFFQCATAAPAPGGTPELVGQLPAAQAPRLGGYVTMFPGLIQIVDPSRANLTAVGALNFAPGQPAARDCNEYTESHAIPCVFKYDLGSQT